MSSTDTIKNFFGLHKMPFGKLIGVNELYRSSSLKRPVPACKWDWRMWMRCS